MTTAYSIGIDLHRTVIQICVLDERGERVAEERIRYRSLEEGEKAIAWLRHFAPSCRIAVEAPGLNRWFANACLAAGLDVLVCDPRKLDLKKLGKKTDRRDAREIARLNCDFGPGGTMSLPEKASGACLCGAVRFTASLPSLSCAHCHCSMCRRNHGAGYVTWFAVPPAQLVVESGADQLVRYESSVHGNRSFCRRCGSSLFCENTQHPDRIDIALGAMVEPIDREPQLHTYFDSRASWIRVGDELPRLGGKTGLEPLPETKPQEGG